MNISKYTTHRELVEIQGVPDHIRRRIGFNLAGGHVNAVEICVDLYKAPTLDQMLESYWRKKGLASPQLPVLYDPPPLKPHESNLLAGSEPLPDEEEVETDPLDEDFDTHHIAD